MIILSDEDHDKSDETLDIDSAQAPETGSTPENTQNNLESAHLQEQAQTNHSDLEPASDVNPQHDDNKDTDTFHDNDKKSQDSASENLVQVLENLADFDSRIESDLRWKERLKLLTLDANLGLPYYNLWRLESNMLFRRSVILRKRRKKLEQKGD